MLHAVFFNMFAETPSHLVDLFVSRVVSSSYTDFSVEGNCFGQFTAGRFSSRAFGDSVKGGKL